MREAIVGFDSAWGDRVPGAAAWWHPNIIDGEERKRCFRREYPRW